MRRGGVMSRVPERQSQSDEVRQLRQVGERLRVGEERFRLIMENVEDVAIFLLDLPGRVVDWNEGTERLFGYRTEEVLGKDLSSFFLPEDVAAGLPERELRQAATV